MVAQQQLLIIIGPFVGGCVGSLIAWLRGSRPGAGFLLGLLFGPVGWIITAIFRIAPKPAPAPSGWWPDPTGRYQLRYWDGRLWTSGVITNGAQGVDRHPL